jgi:hypothetical protein
VNDAAIDWSNVAEEIESVGRSERRELRNRLARPLQHLLKWRYQQEASPFTFEEALGEPPTDNTNDPVC